MATQALYSIVMTRDLRDVIFTEDHRIDAAKWREMVEDAYKVADIMKEVREK